jgi:hypothetical protein
MRASRIPLALLLFTLVSTAHAAPAPARPPTIGQQAKALGQWVVVSWNDLGMHCINRLHLNFSVLPPYNNLRAQVIQRGDATHMPQITTTGVTVGYSVPGNTYSVGKTDFWTYSLPLFGVTLAPNIGLTGKGLTGSLDPGVGQFAADGIPVTPYPDATPTVESPYQQALVIARDAGGIELARSTPTIPVSADMSCVSSGCHASEQAILNSHPDVSGFDPGVKPILCARCHADPVLGTTGTGDANYFSYRLHNRHKFIDQSIPGVAGCYKCHPGSSAQCLRGAMSQQHNMICQDCHGNMANVAATIQAGRVPWMDEPRCGTCHTSQHAEEPGKLYKLSVGHGGVACSGCHNSTHAELPSREAADNANNIALQGFSGTLRECTVCHGVTPAGAGPHGLVPAGVPGEEVLVGARPLRAYPNPARGEVAIELSGRAVPGGLLMIHDVQGRIVTHLVPTTTGDGTLRAKWDGRNAAGAKVIPGTYFVRWIQGTDRAAARVTLVE